MTEETISKSMRGMKELGRIAGQLDLLDKIREFISDIEYELKNKLNNFNTNLEGEN